jgi:hypothetical protein
MGGPESRSPVDSELAVTLHCIHYVRLRARSRPIVLMIFSAPAAVRISPISNFILTDARADESFI